MDHTVSFLLKTTLKFCAKLQWVWAPSSHWKPDTVLQGEISIASWVFHSLLSLNKNARKSFGQYTQTPYDLHCIISVKNNFQISCEISYFGHPLGTGYGILWNKERHPLLLDCFIPFLKCMRMIMGAPECIYKPLTYGQHYVVSTGLI